LSPQIPSHLNEHQIRPKRHGQFPAHERGRDRTLFMRPPSTRSSVSEFQHRTSLVVARELARHADVKMTMRYTHIGLQDQAKGIQNLPTDPKWLESRRSADSASQHICSSSQHICSESGVSEGQSQSPADSECHPKGENANDTSPCEESPSDYGRQKKAPSVTDGALLEAAGFRNENRNPMKCKALRNSRFSNWTQLWPILAP